MPASDNQMAASQSTVTQAGNLGGAVSGQSPAKSEPATSVQQQALAQAQSQATDYYFSASSHSQQINSNHNVHQQNNRQQQHGHMLSNAGSDTYLSGMASDSELSGARGSARQHHHSHTHHRPAYGATGGPRAYHAHPSPRASHGSSRMSHYSDSAASYSPISATNPIYSQQQTQQAMQQSSHQRAMSHQGSVSSSASGGSMSPATAVSGLYTGLMGSGESPLSSGILNMSRAGRQLPQRPFKQSVSIDHQAGMYSRQSPTLASHPLSEGSGNEMQRQQPSYHQQPSAFFMAQRLDSQQQAYGQQQTPGADPRSPQYPYQATMDLMEKQVANMNLYESISESRQQQAPQTTRPASASSMRQLPPIGAIAAAGGQTAGSLSSELHYGAISATTSNHPPSQQMHHAYSQSEPLNHPAAMSAGYAMGSLGSAGHRLHQRASQQKFKQAISIDHYAGQHSRPQSMSSYHQQQHQAPVRTSSTLSQQASDQTYRSALNYASSAPVCGHESSANTGATYNQRLAQQQHQHSTHTPQSGQSMASYSVGHQPQHTSSLSMAYDSPVFARSSVHQDPMTSYQPHHAHSQDSAMPSGVAGATTPTSHHSHQPRAPSSSTSSSHQNARPSLQQQLSSSSSNSQSGSLNRSNADVHKASTSAGNTGGAHDLLGQQRRAAASAALPPQAQPFQSPQHTKPSAGNIRHTTLRKGYTSVHSDTFGFGGISSPGMALSDSGELSASATLATPHHSAVSGSYGSKRVPGMRTNSPSTGLDSGLPTTSGHSHHPHQSAVSGQREASAGSRSESSTGLPAGGSGSSLTKKSNSATQLSMTGTKKRLGFRRKQVTSFSVHRSEEVAPFEARHLVKQGSSVSEGDSSMSGDSSSRSWSNSNFKQPTPDELASMSFIDGLGKGQMISRQGLASPYLGDIELSLCDRRGNLEVEVIRARNLQAKTSKVLPLTYVKLYLVKNRKCLAKAKTLLSNKRTLDPFFHQQLTFHEDYHGCILQSIIWGNFGKMDKKNFMGIAQISIDDLELSEQVVSWYKLFLPSSLQTLPSKSLRHTLLSNSTESFTNTNNS